MTLPSPVPDPAGLRDYASEWALVDVETSGLVPRRDRVLSVAVVTPGPDGGRTDEFSTTRHPRALGSSGPAGTRRPPRNGGALGHRARRPVGDGGRRGRSRAHAGGPGERSARGAAGAWPRGTHAAAVAARARVVELGGAAAINLSASVTDVVVLDEGRADRRSARIASLELPVHEAGRLADPAGAGQQAAPGRADAVRVLPRGGVVDLPRATGPGAAHSTVTATWAQQASCETDVVAFVVDEDEQVSFDDDVVFYGTPENPAGTVRLLSDGPTEQTVSMDLPGLPPGARKVVIAAAIDGALLAEVYRRGPVWRLRAVGQGYDHGLDVLARAYGVDVAD